MKPLEPPVRPVLKRYDQDHLACIALPLSGRDRSDPRFAVPKTH